MQEVGMLKATIRSIQDVHVVHQVDSPNTAVPVQLSGGEHVTIWGHSTTMMSTDAPLVVLLSEGSTPQKREVHPDAVELFNQAASALLESDIEFYTVLRPQWIVRPVLWTKERR